MPDQPLKDITDHLVCELATLNFQGTVKYVYNPLIYARRSYDLYLKRYGAKPKEIILLGMNPGPWGMAQTGIPFGEVNLVRDWLQIEAPINQPEKMHPKRTIQGFACTRSEVSGRRLWGWVQKHFKTPQKFFSRFLILNYCPLIFMEESGRNKTPNTLPASEQKPLLEICDKALTESIKWLEPKYVIGVGKFAADRARQALHGLNFKLGVITHPSPANPKANRGWDQIVEKELLNIGIKY